MGLRQTAQDRYILAESSREQKFFVFTLPSGQLLWESDVRTSAEDATEILRAMSQLDQSVHVNVGTRGTTEETSEPPSAAFYLEEGFKSVTELEDKAKVSVHQVTARSAPYLPPQANMVINAWCFSHRYGFADRVDYESGRITEDKHVEGIYMDLPRRLRHIIKSMLGDDEGVEDAMEGYMETNCSNVDPEHRETVGVPSGELLDTFLHNEEKQVLLLLGQAGAGKSTWGKRWVIELGERGVLGERYPVFLHLPKSTSVKESLEKAAGVCYGNEKAWREFVRGRLFFVVMDSFDEIRACTNVVDGVFKELSGCKGVKAVVTCRSCCVKKEVKSNPLLWPPGPGGRDAVEVAWICRVRMSNKERVKRYIDYHVSKTKGKDWERSKYEEAMESMDELREVVNTPYLLKVTLSALPRIHEKKTRKLNWRIDRHRIFKQFAIDWYTREWNKLKQIKHLADRATRAGVNDENYMSWYSAAAKELCLEMCRQQKKILVQKVGDTFLSGAPPSSSTQGGDEKDELLYWLLRGCLTQVEFGKHAGSFDVRFVHDLIWGFFLVESTLEQLRRQCESDMAVPESLALVDLREEIESIKEHAMAVRGKAKYSEKLLDVVRASRLDRLKSTGRASANAATILVAAGVSFSGLDLQGVRVAGAILRNGIFHRTDLREADLSDVDASHTYLAETRLEGARLEGTDFGGTPTVRIDWGDVDKEKVCCRAFEPGGQAIAAGLKDGTVRIYDLKTGRCCKVLTSRGSEPKFLSWRADGKALASGCEDGTITVWDMETGNCWLEVKGKMEKIGCISLRSDGQIAWTTESKTFSLRRIDLTTGECRQEQTVDLGQTELLESTDWCTEGKWLAVGPNGKRIAAISSTDKKVRVWEVETGR
eukprot:748946-Hanusia_phi.AAC.2